MFANTCKVIYWTPAWLRSIREHFAWMLTPSVISSQALTTNVVAFPFRPLHGLLSQEDPHHYGEFITLLLTSRQTLTHVIMSQNDIFMPTKNLRQNTRKNWHHNFVDGVLPCTISWCRKDCTFNNAGRFYREVIMWGSLRGLVLSSSWIDFCSGQTRSYASSLLIWTSFDYKQW